MPMLLVLLALAAARLADAQLPPLEIPMDIIHHASDNVRQPDPGGPTVTAGSAGRERKLGQARGRQS